MKCSPHYIRCIKPNETKKAHDWEESRVKHQVEYLGLRENIRVRRAGFAYRRAFDKFLWRYAILTKETWPRWGGEATKGIRIILNSVNMDQDQFQLGKSKVFIKNPESLFLLEEVRERKYDGFARIIQKAFRQFTAKKHYARLKEEACDLLYNKKERRRHSINRNFVGDYIGLDHKPGLRALVGKREPIKFADTVDKFDRRFKATKRDLILTSKAVYLIGREQVKKGPDKGKIMEVIKRKIPIQSISHVSLSPYQDDFMVIFVANEYASVVQSRFKTEFLQALSKRYHELTNGAISLQFIPVIDYTVKKQGVFSPEGQRKLQFSPGNTRTAELKPTSKVLNITIEPGLPKNSRPGIRRSQTPDILRQTGSGSTYERHAGRGAQQMDASSVINRRLSSTKTNQTAPALPRSSVASGGGSRHSRSGPTRPPPPAGSNPMANVQAALADVLRTPSAGRAGEARQSVRGSDPKGSGGGGKARPPPGGGRPKPAPRPKSVSLPQCRALYAYDAQDTDELSFNAGDVIGIKKEDPTSWWLGVLRGKEGLFPANYVEKI